MLHTLNSHMLCQLYLSKFFLKSKYDHIIPASQLPDAAVHSGYIPKSSPGPEGPAVCPGLASASAPLPVAHPSLAALQAVFWTRRDCDPLLGLSQNILSADISLTHSLHSGFFSSAASARRPSLTSLSPAALPLLPAHTSSCFISFVALSTIWNWIFPHWLCSVSSSYHYPSCSHLSPCPGQCLPFNIY